MTNKVFLFTDSLKPDSSAVDEAWYHEVKRELAVNLHGVIYKYSGVSAATWEKFKDSDSKGQFYRYNIQRSYSPAERLGSRYATSFQREYVPVVAESMSSIHTGKTTMPVSQDRVNGPNRPVVDKWGYERPKQFATGGYVQPSTTGAATATTGTMFLRFDTDKAVVRKHVVTFTANGKERQHTLKVVNVDEAVRAIEEIAAMLDLKFEIRKVEVFFE